MALLSSPLVSGGPAAVSAGLWADFRLIDPSQSISASLLAFFRGLISGILNEFSRLFRSACLPTSQMGLTIKVLYDICRGHTEVPRRDIGVI
jgi:hypothetical protein